MILHLRGLVGEWEDGEAIFLGAVPQLTYEAIYEDDAAEETDNWGQRKQEWIDAGPDGIENTCEVEVRLSLPNRLFQAPEVSARGLPVEAGGEGE